MHEEGFRKSTPPMGDRQIDASRMDSGFTTRHDRVMAEAGVLERLAGDPVSRSYTARRAEILADLDRRARQAETADMRRRYSRPWWRLVQWRDARR